MTTYIDPRSLLLGLFIGLFIGLLSGMFIPASAAAFNDTLPGDRNLGDAFTVSIQNVSNRASVTYHFEVYATRIIGKNYTYYSPNWGTWYVRDANPGCKFFVIWVKSWSEGTTSWGYGADRFNLWIGSNTIPPDPVQMRDFTRIYHKNQYRPVLIRELENRKQSDGSLLTTERYAWRDGVELDRLEPGESNAFDGVIIYQIPEWADMKDIRICGWFGYYGTAIWNIIPKEITQISLETYREAELRRIELEKRARIRLPDRISSTRVKR